MVIMVFVVFFILVKKSLNYKKVDGLDGLDFTLAHGLFYFPFGLLK